jgi:Fe-S-cluster containining protein
MASKDAERARALVRQRITTAREAMAECDDQVDRELEALAARGVTASCSRGCAACCRQAIFTTRAEAETIVEWLQATWSAEQIEALKSRIRDWLRWYRTEYRALVDGGMRAPVAMLEHGPFCVALIDRACSLYPVRPMACRIHFVSSPPDACASHEDPRAVELSSISRVTQPSLLKIRGMIERQGSDFLATVHLLPEWLAHLLRVDDQPWRTSPPLFPRGAQPS